MVIKQGGGRAVQGNGILVAIYFSGSTLNVNKKQVYNATKESSGKNTSKLITYHNLGGGFKHFVYFHIDPWGHDPI